MNLDNSTEVYSEPSQKSKVKLFLVKDLSNVVLIRTLFHVFFLLLEL